MAVERILGSHPNPKEAVRRIRKEFDTGKTRWGRHDVAALLEQHDIWEYTAMEDEEILGDIAKRLSELTVYDPPEHDPKCVICNIARALDALVKEKLNAAPE